MGRKTQLNSITSPELLRQVNKENIELMNDFLDYMKSIQRSDSTIDAYRSDLNIAFVWCLEHNNNEFYCNWTKRQVARLQSWLLNENKNSPARVRRVKASLSSLGNYVENMLDDDYPNFRNIIKKVENPPNQLVREKTIWSDEEVESLLSTLVKKEKYDQACCLALAAFGGRRKAELVRFKVSDFGDDHLVCGGSLYKSDPIKTKGRGLGKFINCYTLANKFKPYLDMWMKYREQAGIESIWLFPAISDMSAPMSVTTENSWANSFSRIMEKPFYWHSLRHYFTTSLAKSGIPDSVIQSLISWESSDMVRLYDDTSTDEQIGMYFNENGMVIPEKKSISDL